MRPGPQAWRVICGFMYRKRVSRKPFFDSSVRLLFREPIGQSRPTKMSRSKGAVREKGDFWENEVKILTRNWKFCFVSLLLTVTRGASQANGRMSVHFLRFAPDRVHRCRLTAGRLEGRTAGRQDGWPSGRLDSRATGRPGGGTPGRQDG